ncbi:hypothetical protein AB0D35_18990 [Streptomyces sp. NPDC048301]|uniref:hypothetical protein n=1 Tax=unclassified Streptomyces TaxID=2593676 RepID=UPI00343AD848
MAAYELRPPGRAEADVVWWQGGLDPARPRPLVVVAGGALSGGPDDAGPPGALGCASLTCGAGAARLSARLVSAGYAVVAAGLPHPAHRAERPASYISRLIDRHAEDADTSRTAVIGFDLGGRHALAAASDPRIGSVHLVGAPVFRLFDEPDRLPALPARTAAALAAATGPAGLGGLALRAEQLYEIGCAVRVGYAPDDPLTTPQDLALLKLTVANAEFHAFPATGRTTPRGGTVHRWLLDGVRRAGRADG